MELFQGKRVCVGILIPGCCQLDGFTGKQNVVLVPVELNQAVTVMNEDKRFVVGIVRTLYCAYLRGVQ